MTIRSMAVLSSATVLFTAGLLATTPASAKTNGVSYFCTTHPKAAACKVIPRTGAGGTFGGITVLPSSGGANPASPGNDLLAALGAAGLAALGFGIRRRANRK